MRAASPAVSVCIASYNHARYLPECLDSILSQTYQDFEIVVVDDGSKDNSHDILLGYQERYPGRVRYSWHAGHANRGISVTTNAAIRESRGKYIAFIGSDDVWYPEKLRQQVEQLEANPGYGYVYSYAERIDENGTLLPGLYGADITQDPNPTGRMVIACHQPAMTVIIRRACLDTLEWFDEALVYSDWDLMIRITALWQAGFIDRPLAKYRIHGQNISKKIDPGVDLKRILGFTSAIQEKLRAVGGKLAEPRNQALLSLQLAFLHFCQNDQQQSTMHLAQAYQADPTLAGDLPFFNEWLNSWKPEFFTPAHAHFGFWAIDHLPDTVPTETKQQLFKMQLNSPGTRQFFIERGIQKGKDLARLLEAEEIYEDCPAGFTLPARWKSGIWNEIYPTLLFDSYQKNQYLKTRYYWWKTVSGSLRCLKNRGVWSIGIQTFLRGGGAAASTNE